MPTNHPRVNVAFSEDDVNMMHSICKRKKISMSALIRKVMEDWLEDYEDMVLSKQAEAAEEKWEREGKPILSHEEMWKRLNT